MWKTKDPIPAFRDKLLEMGVTTPKMIEEIHNQVAWEIHAAVLFAEESPLPEPDELYQDVYTEEA